jgi:hypothetical protein
VEPVEQVVLEPELPRQRELVTRSTPPIRAITGARRGGRPFP